MAIQHRRGIYNRFDPTRLVAGEWAIVLSGDTSASDGMAAYICFAAGTVKRVATFEDMAENIAAANEQLIQQLTEELTENCEDAADRANTAAQTCEDGEEGRVAAEATRVSNETARVSAESARASAESTRASAETTRVSNESARVSAESARASAEQTRVSNETARVSAETARASAEETRIAKGFSSAFEASLLIDPTLENISIWVEQCGITYEQLDQIIREAEQLSERYAVIADVLKNTIKPKHWRHEDDQEETPEDTQGNEDQDTADFEG